MKYVDYAEIHVLGGHGGRGNVSFRREKYVDKGGPDGGTGGKGGDVILQVSEKIQTLMDLKIKRRYKAKEGAPGGGKNKTGASGKDTLIRVPKGTMIFDENKNLLADLTEESQLFTAARGGSGGRGNKLFANSRNRAPSHAQPGMPGEDKSISLEIRMIAQVGFIGLPNAGKSTLLKALTRANPKIASYPFTTLYPNLGILKFHDKEVVLADIPGLIEGASRGEGLGHEFLRHIERTEVLVHLIDMSCGDKDKIWKNFLTVQEELKKSPHELLKKDSIVALSKSDTVNDSEFKEIGGFFKEKGVNILAISSETRKGLTELTNHILNSVNTKKT